MEGKTAAMMEGQLQSPEGGHAESQVLATATRGRADEAHGEAGVRDLGWTDGVDDAAPLVGGLEDEELWTLIRRFDKVCTRNTSGNRHELG